MDTPDHASRSNTNGKRLSVHGNPRGGIMMTGEVSKGLSRWRRDDFSQVPPPGQPAGTKVNLAHASDDGLMFP
jgi:hypothetical protein